MEAGSVASYWAISHWEGVPCSLIGTHAPVVGVMGAEADHGLFGDSGGAVADGAEGPAGLVVAAAIGAGLDVGGAGQGGARVALGPPPPSGAAGLPESFGALALSS